jgi:hypothetical protein
VNGIKPASAPLSALAWATWGQRLKVPTPGAVMVYSRTGGGHVTLYESEDANYYYCRGGNQSDSVNVTKIPKSRPIKAIRWPAGVPLPTTGRKIGATRQAVKRNYAAVSAAGRPSGLAIGNEYVPSASSLDCSSSRRLSIKARSRSVSSVSSSRRYRSMLPRWQRRSASFWSIMIVILDGRCAYA